MLSLFDIFASLALGFAFFGGGGAPRPAAAPPAPPASEDPNVQARRAARRFRGGLEQGFRSTIATSPLGTTGGVGDQQQGQVQKLG